MFYFPIIWVLIVVYFLYKFSSLQRQIDELKRGAPAQNTMPERTNMFVAETPMMATTVQTASIIEQRPPVERGFDVIDWMRENWILKLGILMIIAGFGWFVSYAFVHNWIGPVGRITLGFILGAAVTVFGDIRMKKSNSQGAAFLILGSAIILVTVSAARFIHSYFNPFMALLIVFLTASYVTITAMRYNRINLAIVGVLMASIAPMFTNSAIDDVVNRFMYIFVVTISAIWVMFYKNWREVGATSALVVLVYSIIYGLMGNLGINEDVVLGLAYLLSLIFFVVNIVSICRFKDQANSSDMFMAVINSGLVILWTLSHVGEDIQSLMLAMWMIVFAAGSFVVFKYSGKLQFFYIYSLTAVVYLITATAIELDGSALVFAFIFESAVIAFMGYIVTSKVNIGERLSLLMIGPALMTLQSFDSYRWRDSFMHEDFALILCMGLVLLGVGTYFFMINRDDHPEEKSGMVFRPYSIMMIAGSFYLFGLVWLTTGVIYEAAVAVMVSLAIYTIIGITSYFFGKKNDRVVYRNYGAFLLLVVVARLVFVDVWDMDLAVRIVTFILIGLLFVSTAFIAGKKHETVITTN